MSLQQSRYQVQLNNAVKQEVTQKVSINAQGNSCVTCFDLGDSSGCHLSLQVGRVAAEAFQLLGGSLS